MFLASSWYSTEDATADKKRGWFVAHAGGASFRSLNLPIVMTRKMEHIFLASQDHLAIEHAIRRAELLALGALAEFVQAVLSTRLATDLSNSMFWRTVWSFLIANAVIQDENPRRCTGREARIQLSEADRSSIRESEENYGLVIFKTI